MAAFTKDVEAIRFPPDFTDQVEALIVTTGDLRDQNVKAARAKTFREMELVMLMSNETPAQACADALRKSLGLPALHKPFPWRYDAGVM